MNIPMLNAVVEGYSEYLFDQQCLAAHQGYWAGYFQSKRPKPLKLIIDEMVRDHSKAKKKASGSSIAKPEVDMVTIRRREAKLKLVKMKG